MYPSNTNPVFDSCMSLFDASNAEDPRIEEAKGQKWPKELLYAKRMSGMLSRF